MSLFVSFGLAVLIFVLALFALAMLIDFWCRADLEMGTKFTLTQAYPLSWMLLFENVWVFVVGQMSLMILFGWMTARSLRGSKRSES